jgi:hypothetical protein
VISWGSVMRILESSIEEILESLTPFPLSHPTLISSESALISIDPLLFKFCWSGLAGSDFFVLR